MSLFDELESEWERECTSVVARRAMHEWRADASLRSFTSPSQLVSFLQERGHPKENDDVLRPLVMRARDDDFAMRTVLHALTPGLRSLARRYSWADTHDEVVATTVEAALQRIRNYPLRTRPNRIAANVLGDTKGKLFKRFTDLNRSKSLDELSVHLKPIGPSPVEELMATVRDAVRTGRLNASDASLIVRTRVFDTPVDAVAQEQGVEPQTLRRRRLRAEARLVTSVADDAGHSVA